MHLDDDKLWSNLGKDVIGGNLFKTEMTIQSQVALIKSPELITQTINKLNLDVTYYRVGDIKTSNCYQESPFLVSYDKQGFTCYSMPFDVEVLSDNSFIIRGETGPTKIDSVFGFGEPILFNGCVFFLSLNSGLLNAKDINLVDQYRFVIKEPHLLAIQMGENLDVKSVTKSVPVIELLFKHEVAALSSDFLNTHAEIYIQDYVKRKSQIASNAKLFFETQIDSASARLMNAEFKLQEFKSTYSVINTAQETQKSIGAIANLQNKRAQLILELSALRAFRKGLVSGSYRDMSYSPSAEYGNVLHAEQVKRLQALTEQERELSLKYTDKHEKIHELKSRILSLKSYLLNSLENTIESKEEQWKNLDFLINNESSELHVIPEREAIQTRLLRELKLKEAAYELLYERSLITGVQSSSLIVGHRILKRAVTANQPTSPNKAIIYSVCLAMGFLLSIMTILIWPFIHGRIMRIEQLSENTVLDVYGSIEKVAIERRRISEGAKRIVTRLGFKMNGNPLKTILVTATIPQEGVSSASLQIAKVYEAMGHRVALLCVEADNVFTAIHNSAPRRVDGLACSEYKTKFDGLDILEINGEQNCFAITKLVLEVLAGMGDAYDYVVIDSPPSGNRDESVHLMVKAADAVVYVTRKNKSKLTYLRYANQIAQTYQLKIFGFVFLSGNDDIGIDGTTFSKMRKPQIQNLNLRGWWRSFDKMS
jgi:uncharacterized protein involved in exopolysaccharide biosynthesis